MGLILAQLVLVFGPTLYNQTDREIDIVYETPTVAASTLHYFDGINLERVNSPATDIHNVHLVGLSPETVHYYAIESEGRWSPLYLFQTRKIDQRRIRFGVFGDNQVGDNIFRQVIFGFLRNGCEYWIGAGDYIQNASIRSEWVTKFDRPMLGLSRYIPIVGCRGNHDAETNYAHRYFKVPNGTQWGAITIGTIRFVILDTNQDTFALRVSLIPGGEQRNWLLQEINSPPWELASHRIVIYHHPHATNIWDGGCNYGTNGIDLNLFDIVNNILVPAGTNLIINGHSHSYQHGILPNGSGRTHHVITGGAGGFLDTGNCWRHQHIFNQESSYHYLTLDLIDDILSVRALRLDGSLMEQFEIK